LGASHRFKQDIDFVTSLIPDLYKAGIRNLAYEFYEHTHQAILDSILTAKEWNERLLYHTISSGFAIYWGYTEYLNLLKKVWEFNQTLEPNQPKFRVVLFGPEFNPCKEGELMFVAGVNPDVTMAEVFKREVISKQEKALIYTGTHHAFTRYREREKDDDCDDGYDDWWKGRMGNIIHQKYPEKTFTIMLHQPWVALGDWSKPMVRPVHGVIDSVMEMLSNRPMGFDVRGTIIGQLKADDTDYAACYEDFKLEDFTDGYIFLAPYRDIIFVLPEPNFYDEFNLKRFNAVNKCRNRPSVASKEEAMKRITECPDAHFGHLRK